MTRETAIEILKELWRTKYPLYLESDIRKALEMAIQSLEQEPCNDAISRQAVLDLLEDTNNGWIINEVLQLPSVKPQEKTGHWIEQIDYEENCRTLICSERSR